MANIKFKLGNLELESEGTEEFLKAEVSNFLKLAVETYNQIPTIPAAATKPHSNGNGHVHSGHLQGTTETIAAKLGVKNSPDLAIAAAARIIFVLGKDSFTRSELHGEMKTAKAYFNESHTKNLTQTLRSLVKDGKFNGIGQDTYALTAGAKTDLEPRIHD